MRLSGFIAIGLMSVPPAFAGCSSAETRKMITQGHSDAQIDRQCSQLAVDINGKWQFMSNSQYGGVNEFWKISSANDSVTIQAFRGNRWQPVKILKQALKDNSLKLTIKDQATTRTVYDLQVVSDDLIEGTYRTTDTGFKGMMPQNLISVPMGNGTIQYQGFVRLTKS